MVGAAVTSDRDGKEGQHGSRPRLSLTYCPWFKEFCAYDGGHVDDTHAGRAGAPWTVRAAAMAGTDTTTGDLGEDASNAARLRAPAAHEAHIFAHTRQVIKLTK